ncbi:MAG: 30S ribosomal protein S3 [Candidatus Aenigmarchaeota archaeon]|nr:30S ribosomal protein S3 [Candidatus Aenigmarchaeota archaeon]
MLKQYFVNQGLKEVQIEDFIRKKYPNANYSRMELQRTPLGIKIVIYSSSPGRIIGRGGKTINEITEILKEKFNLENPQVDVKAVQKPDLDARIVAKQIASTLERGFNFKRIGNIMLKRVMAAGAIGAQIMISGRVSGGKAMRVKFIDGYLKHSGEPAKTMVDYGFEEIYQMGRSKPGKVGIKVKIMREFQLITGEKKYSLKDIMPGARAPEPVAEDEKPAKEAVKKEPAKSPAGKKPAKEAVKKPVKKEPAKIPAGKKPIRGEKA